MAPWVPGALDISLTTPRRGLKAVVYNSRIYAIGGYNGMFLKNIDRGSIDSKDGSLQWVLEPDGSLRPWQVEQSSSLELRFLASAFTLGKIFVPTRRA